ncbi:hypothetical protein J6590_020513 [Homalodisca vitripennis]|nr:hypothetical protein J6590_020513 [Homalodisca vitripennis]
MHHDSDSYLWKRIRKYCIPVPELEHGSPGGKLTRYLLGNKQLLKLVRLNRSQNCIDLGSPFTPLHKQFHH